MTSKCNFLPNSSHFLPFCAGLDISLHFSYTSSFMYCKCEVSAGDESFVHVEKRKFEDDSLGLLDAMSGDDFVGPASHFSGLQGKEQALETLDSAFGQLRVLSSERSTLTKELEYLETDSEQYHYVECQLDGIAMDESEARNDIEKIIDDFNRESGYNPTTECSALPER